MEDGLALDDAAPFVRHAASGNAAANVLCWQGDGDILMKIITVLLVHLLPAQF